MEPKFKVGDRVKNTRTAEEFSITAIHDGGRVSLGKYYAEGDVNDYGVWFNYLELVTPAAPVFTEGDLVEAVKGETVIRGRVFRSRDGALSIADSSWSLVELDEMGFTVSLVEAAKPVLPTEPGTFITWSDGAPIPHVAYLEGKEGWRTDNTVIGGSGNEEIWATPATVLAAISGNGFTRLVPEVKNA